jgi:hypothetical protein
MNTSQLAGLVGAVGLVIAAGGCLYPDHSQNKCVLAAQGEQAPAEQLVNPDTLQCQTYSPYNCDPSCGPCPGVAGAALAQPTWGSCSSACRNLDEATCGTTAGCRIARDLADYYMNLPSFLGCYPVDTQATKLAACEGADAWNCSRDDSCAALYTVPTDRGTPMFSECVPEAQLAGSCGGATCDIVAPACPTGTTPGVDSGCYTGACIPDQYCAPL